MIIELPWPLKELNPNVKCHWSKKAKATRKARSDSYYLARSTKPPAEKDGFIEFNITFYPPDRRRRDRTNMEASLKAALDGLADAWGVNDIKFAPRYRLAAPVKGGKVVIEV